MRTEISMPIVKKQQSLKSVAPSRPPGSKNSGYVVRSILEEWLKLFGKDKLSIQNKIVLEGY